MSVRQGHHAALSTIVEHDATGHPIRCVPHVASSQRHLYCTSQDSFSPYIVPSQGGTSGFITKCLRASEPDVEGCVVPLRPSIADSPSASLLSFFMYPDNPVAVILSPFSAKIRTSMLSVYPRFRSAHSSGNTARTIPPSMYEADCGGGSFAFSLRNARSSSTLCDESTCALRRASFSIHKHDITFILVMSNIYDDSNEKTGKRHGKVGAVMTQTPFGRFCPATGPTQSASLLGVGPAHLAQGFAPRPQRNAEMARPQSPEHRKRYTIRLLQHELQQIQQKASTAGLTVSEYFRHAALNIRIRSRINKKALGELSRMTGLQKYLLMKIVGLPHEDELRREFNATLAAIRSTLETLLMKKAEPE